MSNEVLFISDLHLGLDKPAIVKRFIDFLQHRAKRASALYILGDLFDAWVGDDDFTAPNAVIRQHLSQLSASGTAVFLQPGNRDFLIGQRFCQDTGVTLLPDYHIIELAGEHTLLMHGDLLCTDDTAYQAFRVKAHDPEWQKNILAKPLWLRLVAARWYRFRSFLHKRKQQNDIMDVNQQTVIATLERYSCSRLIHGHTHRPGLHEFNVDGRLAQRYVLAAWNERSGQVLSCDNGQFSVEVI